VRIETGVAIRPCQGEVVCGDAQLVLDDGERMVVAVVDGLGHGPSAATASEAFLEFIAEHPDLPLDQMMLEGSTHIAGTRGAAAALVRIDRASKILTYCGIGNVHFHSAAETPMNPVSLPGIVGHRVRKVMPYEFAMPEEGRFVLCSDGISSRIHLEEYAEKADAQTLADAVFAQHSKAHDDVTCVAVTYSAE